MLRHFRLQTSKGQTVRHGRGCPVHTSSMDHPPGPNHHAAPNPEATLQAFAALTREGSVITWGSPIGGGDSSGVQDQLFDVTESFGDVLDFLLGVSHFKRMLIPERSDLSSVRNSGICFLRVFLKVKSDELDLSKGQIIAVL